MSNLTTNNIDQLTTEILVYKQQTAQNIIEIGKRLIAAKEQLPHGEWGKWLEEKVDFSYTSAKRFMQVAREFSNSPTLGDMTQSKVFALLDLPQEEREEFVTENNIDEMTTRQLQQAIKEKKQAEARIAELENRKPEVKIVEKEVVKEVLPNDYQQLKEKSEAFAELEKSLKLKETQLQEIKKEDSEYSRKKSEIQREVKELLEQKEDIERQQDKANLQSKILVKLTNAITPLKKNAVEIEQLLDQNLQYLDLYTIRSIEIEIKYLYKFIDMLQSKISQEVDIIDY